MRKRLDSETCNVIVPTLLLVDGLLGMFLSMYAHLLGLDPTPAWGSVRIAILVISVALVSAAAAQLWLRKPVLFFTSAEQWDKAGIFFLLCHLWAAIFVIYAWFATYGNFTTWDHTSRYFERLADAFQERHLYIDINPGSAFLQSANPYDPKTRAPFSDDIWDMSLYDGKLYAYWGPIPALAILPLQSLLNVQVSDLYITFFFAAGLLVFNSLIILKFSRLFFPQVGIYHIAVAIIMSGLSLPILWNMSAPYVYAAAVCAGAFFMMGGIYFTIAGLEHTPTLRHGSLFVAGTFFACAVGARALQALSVFFVAILILLWIGRAFTPVFRRTEALIALSSFFAPLVVGAILIGWYNWARFDSPLEFGVQYMITTYDLVRNKALIFKPDYFLLNLYAYLLQPFTWNAGFPFLKPVALSETLHRLKIAQPYLYYGGRITGILFSAPILMLGIVPLVSAIRSATRKTGEFSQNKFYVFIIFLLAGTFLAGFVSLLFYFTAQTRFQTDTISQMVLLAILGYWSIIRSPKRWGPIPASAPSILLNLLIGFTVAAGLLLAVTGETDRLETLNPGLFTAILSALKP